MNDGRDRQIEDLFVDALEQPESERAAWLAAAADGDPGLIEEVGSLLAAYERASRFLDPTLFRPRADVAPADAGAHSAERLEEGMLGPWRILRLIATGGMGSVYLAERIDDSFRMQAAIKILSARTFHPGLRTQFRTERQILADLDHPGIARLLDGGTTRDGTPYLVMEYIDGEPLLRFVRERKLSLPERLRLFLEIADAVQYAHSNLVIHRDLKPGNILVRRDGRPKLLDFGIARVFTPRPTDDATTVMGSWAMTPRYASPEQIRGERVTTATDVYSLGVVLYELLTGELPWNTEGSSLAILRDRLDRSDPVPPSRARGAADRRALAGDLDTILLKALAWEPERRFASVADFADDVRRHLKGEAVLARGDSTAYRIGRLVRRHRAFAAGIVAVFAALVVALVVSLVSSQRVRESARLAHWYGVTSTLAAAEAAIRNHTTREARDLLATIPEEDRGWEYRHLESRLDRSLFHWKGHAGGVTDLRWSADGTRLLSTGIDGGVRLWNPVTHQAIAEWSAGTEIESGDFLAGDGVAVGTTDGRVMTAPAPGESLSSLAKGRSYALIDAAPDGRIVAAGYDDGQVVLLDAPTGHELRRWVAHSRLPVPRFSPDGRWLATGGADSLIRIWDAGSGALRTTLHGHLQRVFALDFSSDGRRLASGSRDHAAIVWDLRDGRALSSFSEHGGTVSVLAFHPDGRSVISGGSEGRLLASDVATGTMLGEFQGHESDVSAADISPDGRVVATGEWDGTIRLWAPGTDDIPIVRATYQALPGPFRGLDLSPSDGRAVVMEGGETIFLVSLPAGDHQFPLEFPGVRTVVLADSSAIVAGNEAGEILDHRGSSQGRILPGPGGAITALAFRADRRRLAIGDGEGGVSVWRYPECTPEKRMVGHSGGVTDVAFNTAGDRLASAGEDGVVRLWDAATLEPRGQIRVDSLAVRQLAFDPAGRSLAITTRRGAALHWAIDSGAAPDTLLPPGGGAVAVTFTPDGSRVVIGRSDAVISFIDVEHRAPTVRLHGHIALVSGVAFTPDGRTLVSSSQDGTIRLWQTE